MKKIVIIGGGFAGLTALNILSSSQIDLDIDLIDKKNAFNFLPALPDVISGNISATHLCHDLFTFVEHPQVSFHNEEVLEIQTDNKLIITNKGRFRYDYCLVASGAETNFFGNQSISQQAYKLDNAADAVRIHQDLQIRPYENYVICGGGYSGVEIASHLWKHFSRIGLKKRIIIVEHGSVVLKNLEPRMQVYIGKQLHNLGIEIVPNTTVNDIAQNTVYLNNHTQLENSMLIWAAGMQTSTFVQNSFDNKNRQGRVTVDQNLRFNQTCFFAGDASAYYEHGRPLRMGIQFSISEGARAAGNILQAIKSKPLKSFHPIDLGYLICLANGRGCGRVLGRPVQGKLANFLHYCLCIFRSYGMQNRLGLLQDLMIPQKIAPK